MPVQKTFVGRGWEKKFDNGGSVVNLELDFDKLSALPKNDYGQVRVTVAGRREVDPKSKATHTVYVRHIEGEGPF